MFTETLQQVVRHLRHKQPLAQVEFDFNYAVQALENAPNFVAARQPVDIIAALDARPCNGPGPFLAVQFLALRGWSLPMSLMMYRNFRLLYPMQYNLEMYKLMPRKQLIAELGDTFGKLFSDIFSDPKCQPIFRALLHGEVDVSIQRDTCIVDTRCYCSSNSPSVLSLEAVNPIDYVDARHRLGRVMNPWAISPDFDVANLDPRTIDYAQQIEKAEKALWKTHRKHTFVP